MAVIHLILDRRIDHAGQMTKYKVVMPDPNISRLSPACEVVAESTECRKKSSTQMDKCTVLLWFRR